MGALRVLIVEDEPLVRTDIEDALRQAGYEVAGSAISGEEAIAKSRSLRPDIVLMDITLRGAMTGSTAAQFIQEEMPVPIIFVSAQSTFEKMDESALPNFRVEKPFTREELIDALIAASVQCVRNVIPKR